jgi:predicted outer membrane repeat protein
MKKAIRGSVIICLPVFLIYGCLWFESVDQPTSALPGETFTVSIVTVTTGGIVGYAPYFGVCLPDGWTIPGDAIPCTGVYTETIYYDSLVSAMQENASPAPEGYFWWGGAGRDVETDSGSVYGIVEIQPSNQYGLFSIDYMLGNSYYMQGVNWDRSDNHSIGIADEYTPRNLQANLYSDQQMLNTSLLVDTTFTDENPHDGIQYYAVSAFYDDSTEHLTPYELPVIFGDLYVSPDGNNANNGSSFANALQTITYALSIIDPDSLHPQTILLAPGTYSPYTNGEQFPVTLTSYVSLIGSGEEVTILDAAFQGWALQLAQSSSAEGLAVTNGSGGIYCSGASSSSLTNIAVTGNTDAGIYCSSTTGLSLVNLSITDNYAESGAGIYCINSSMTLENVTISGNTATQSGGGIYCSTSDMTFRDVTITGNSAESGGGIYGNQPNIVFDTILPCNIYLNYADIGNDLCSWGANMYVIVDTFTVLNPTEFQAYPIEDYVFFIQQGMVLIPLKITYFSFNREW